MSLKCEICQEDYDKDTVMISCEKCDSKVPIECDDNGSKCYIKCDYCQKTVCKKHRFSILPYSSTSVDEICDKCFMEIDTYGAKFVNTMDVKTYYDNIIEKKDSKIAELEAKVKQLQAMVDYQPGGEGYVKAKGHFDELSEKLKK